MRAGLFPPVGSSRCPQLIGWLGFDVESIWVSLMCAWKLVVAVPSFFVGSILEGSSLLPRFLPVFLHSSCKDPVSCFLSGALITSFIKNRLLVLE